MTLASFNSFKDNSYITCSIKNEDKQMIMITGDSEGRVYIFFFDGKIKSRLRAIMKGCVRNNLNYTFNQNYSKVDCFAFATYLHYGYILTCCRNKRRKTTINTSSIPITRFDNLEYGQFIVFSRNYEFVHIGISLGIENKANGETFILSKIGQGHGLLILTTSELKTLYSTANNVFIGVFPDNYPSDNCLDDKGNVSYETHNHDTLILENTSTSNLYKKLLSGGL